ncbi:MAG: uracil-DNA glycosylase, partial [Candidatus Methanomethylophilaceae archaeon]
MRPSPDCRLCTLSQNRSLIVLPEGDPCSPVVFVGEAPGEKEDQSGRPFVGRSGRILDGMLEEAGLPRGSILITNTVKCRPPGNRDPQREEMAACLPFLQHELKDRELVVG